MINIDGQVIVLGDIHGRGSFISKMERKWCGIEVEPEASIIQVGDFGVFRSSDSILEKVHNFCERHDVHFYAIRGNHDNPFWWGDGAEEIHKKYPRITMIPDYTSGTINGESVLFVGGAVSIDRHYRTPHLDYFPEEGFVYKSGCDEHDILIIHTAPSNVNKSPDGSDISYYFQNDPALPDDLYQERMKVDLLVKDVQPKLVIGGHFHNHYNIDTEKFQYICLNIDEYMEIG